jgi:nucleoside-diphosphate-sugar epimerase
MHKLLITGANGFIGRKLCQQLTAENFGITPLTHQLGEITHAATWQSLPPTDVVIHLASKTFVPDSWNNPGVFIETNTLGTLQALEYCRKHGAAMIYISSYLYGNPSALPIPETAPLFTPNPYAFSKKTAEDYCKFYHDCFQVPVTILRPFNIYGEEQHPSFLIPMLIEQALHQSEFRVKDLLPKRDYLYINDFISALIACIPLRGFHLFNLGSGCSYSVAEIIEILQEIQNTQFPVYSENLQRPNEIMNTIADIQLAKQLLHWQPSTSMEEGLRRLLHHYQSANSNS